MDRLIGYFFQEGKPLRIEDTDYEDTLSKLRELVQRKRIEGFLVTRVKESESNGPVCVQ